MPCISFCSHSSAQPLFNVGSLKGPEIHHENHIGPKITKHFGQHSQRSFERPRKPILVPVDYQEAVDFFDLITKDIHQLIHKLSIVCVFETGSINDGNVWPVSNPPAKLGFKSKNLKFFSY